MKTITLSALLSVALLTGCAPLGPNFSGVDSIKVPASWAHHSKRNDAQIAQWWKIFDDRTLDTLVQKAYAQNLDLKAAGLRILQSRAALGIATGLQYPQVQTLSGNVAGIRKNNNSFSATGLNFDIGWEMDIWGKYARGIESSEATLYTALASYNDSGLVG